MKNKVNLTMLDSFFYKISSGILNILNLYLNETEKKNFLYIFSFLENRSIPKTRIRRNFRILKENIKSANLDNTFKLNIKKSIEDNIVNLLNGYKEIVKNISDNYKSEFFYADKLIKINSNNFYGISGEEKELIYLMQYLYRYKNLFKIILVNGSIGSRDYKPGWSDVDIFLIIKSEILSSKNKLKELRKISLKIKRFIMNYCILQDHGVFYSSEYHMKANYNEFFPIACLKTGQVIIDGEKIQFKFPHYKQSALNYFQSIYLSSKNLYFSSKIKELDLISKVILFHRIFAFPFSFLQCFGYNIGKKESFKKLENQFQNIFPNISQFYQKVNKFYLDWNIKKLHTYKTRKLLSPLFTLGFLNKKFIYREKDVVNRIRIYYYKFNKKGIFDEFNKYLDIANDYLEDNFPEYHNNFRPYLKKEFYNQCIKKIHAIFSRFNEIISIYQFGSITAPGNSDIDLIFVTKENVRIFNKILNTFRTRFTKNEQFITFQHKPFVINSNITQFINFIFPCNNIKHIYGKKVTFKDVANPFVKFNLLIEFIIFTRPKKFPDSINRLEDLSRRLQNINTIKYLINLFSDVKQTLNIQSNIKFTKINNLIEKNDKIRKNVYLYNLNFLKSHINLAYEILNEILFKIMIDVAHFIENHALIKNFRFLKKAKPVLEFCNYFFIANENKLRKIKTIRKESKIYYYPWSFYFFYRQHNYLRKDFREGFKKRNGYLAEYLKYTTIFNQGLNLYLPFWYKYKSTILLPHIWKLIPRFLKNMYIFYYLYWKIFPNIKIKQWFSSFLKKIQSFLF